VLFKREPDMGEVGVVLDVGPDKMVIVKLGCCPRTTTGMAACASAMLIGFV